MTWMKSMMMCTRASWSAAWVLMRSIWWLVAGGGGDDVGGGPHHGGRVVDSADLGHALAVALLAFGQAGGQLAAGRGLGGGLPKRLGAHDDALGVAGQHQHVGIGALLWCAGGVEVLDVGRGAHGQLLCLALAQQHPGGPLHRLHSGAERAAGGLDGLRRRSPWECFSSGRPSAASAGYRLVAPRAR